MDEGISRREMLRAGGSAVAGAALLSACNPFGGAPKEDANSGHDRVTRSTNPIPRENRRAGTTDWKQSGEFDGRIAGFASSITARRGQGVNIFVSTDAPTYRAEVYRMGWYGGKGARLMHVEEGLKGVQQEVPGATRYPELMIETDWKHSFRIRTGMGWTTGVYLVKLKSSLGSENYAPFILRDDRPSAIFYGLPVSTWLAYNVWGGRGIYKCISGKGAGDWEARSRLVSFDRPFSQLDSGTTNGADRFFNFDYAMVRYLEREGYDVSYGTSIDVHARPKLLLQHDLYVSAGHDEYWSKEMRDNLETVRDAGVNLAFLGANAGYRAVRFEDSELGKYRRMRHYKDHEEDPLFGKQDDRVAAHWRYGPLNRPENELIGIMYVASPVDDPWVCSRTDHWLFDGTGLKQGYEVPHMVGHEFDRAYTRGAYGSYSPENLEILSESPVKVISEDGSKGQKDVAHTSLYTARSGAGVFASGTIRWSWMLDDFGGSYYESEVHRADPHVQKLTARLFDAMSHGPLERYIEKNNLG